MTNTCEACGQPLLLPIGMCRCEGCGKNLQAEGGRMVRIAGACAPYCFGCAPVAELAQTRVEQAEQEGARHP